MRKIVIILIFFLSLCSCETENQLTSDKSLTYQIESEFNSKSKIINLSKIVDFKWDSLLILEPYSTIKSYEDSLHLNLKNIRENYISYRESLNVLVFLKNGKSIKISEIPRKTLEFENLNLLVEKSRAEFIKMENGNYKLIDEMNRNILKRVSGIPKTAFWAESEGKGNWFDVEWINNHQNMTRISIFDNSGELVLKSRFMKVCPVNELKFIEDLKKEIDFYDGKKIQLKDNCYLQTN
jgi:hypothetical protein